MDLRTLLETIWNAFSPWLSSVLVIAATTGVLIVTRFLLKRAGKDSSGVPYQRQMASTLIVLVGVFAAVIFLPIAPDVRGQILSLLGVLISAVIAFSSTSLVGNAMAGIMMRLSKSYRPGDFIEVGDIIGRVTDQGLFHTSVQLITRDLVALPNLYLSSHPVHVTRSSGTFVSVEVSLGYETPPNECEDALNEAVGEAGLEEPYVLVEGLLDHAITYRVFGLLEDTKELLSARSRLRRGIVTTLHRHGIQIVSPDYVNRVEYPSDHRFIPDQTSTEEPKARDESEKVEAIAFDKAEEAESIERLKALRDKLAHRHEELDGEIKEAEDREQKKELQEEQKEVSRRSDRVAEIIEQRQEEREEKELEE